MKKLHMVSLIALLALSFAASVAGAVCVTCANNHCAYVSSGHGACTEPYYPDFFCKLACPNCPTVPCDPGGGGGGGGDCFRADNNLGKNADGQVVTTLGVLFESNPSLNANIFGGQSSRVLPAAAFGGFTVQGADKAITSVNPKATGRLQMAYAFASDNNAGIGVSFVTKQAERIAFAGVSNGLGSRVQVHARDASLIDKQVSEVTVGNDDITLVDVSLNGRSYVLALCSMSNDGRAADFAQRLEKIKSTFKDSVRDFPRPAFEPLIMIIPDC